MTTTSAEDVRSAVRGALRAGDVERAVELALAHLARQEDPELRLVVGQWYYVTAQFDASREQLETALRLFQVAGQPRRAALAASALGRLYFDVCGSPVLARGWFSRADRLLQEEEPCVEQGWVWVASLGCAVADAAELLAKAERALQLARRFGDVDLEAKALADRALALVRVGRVGEGLEGLDEAIALVSSGSVTPIVSGMVLCDVLTVCQRTGDLGRAEAWRQFLSDHGFLARPGAGRLLSSHCDGAQGSLLCSVGRWQEAEAVLERGVATASRGMNWHKVLCQSALAELRVRQGRLVEAEQLLLGTEDRLEAILPLARLHLARHDYDLAAAVAQRGLRQLRNDQGCAVHLLALLVDAELGRNDVAAADAAARQLADLADEAELPSLRAHAALARASVAAAAADIAGATALLHQGLASLADSDPLLRASLHLELARLQAPLDRAAAAAEAQAAAAIHTRVDAPLPAGSARLFAELGVAVPAPPGWKAQRPAGARTATLARDGDAWAVTHGTLTACLRDTKGLRYLAELVARPGVELHVLDLTDVVEGAPGEGGPDRRRLGDAGAALDGAAKAAYRRRLEQLREEMEAADAVEDDERMARIQVETDALVAELRRAVGLGGRDRRAASAAEKARLNVTRAVRSAIARVTGALPAAGGDLDRDVHTGSFCSYRPDPTGIVWSVVQSPVNGRRPG